MLLAPGDYFVYDVGPYSVLIVRSDDGDLRVRDDGRGAPSRGACEVQDLAEAAANLFSHLRALDASGARRIAVMKVPHEGLGEAINDRLKRAAAPR